MMHVFLHVAMVLCLAACFNKTMTEATLHTKTYIQVTTVLAVVYWTSSCVHATIAMIIIQCRCARRRHQELVFVYGLLSILIGVERISILCATQVLKNQSDIAVAWFSVFLAVSIVTAFLDLVFCIGRSH
jgi:hypothetical protein